MATNRHALALPRRALARAWRCDAGDLKARRRRRSGTRGGAFVSGCADAHVAVSSLRGARLTAAPDGFADACNDKQTQRKRNADRRKFPTCRAAARPRIVGDAHAYRRPTAALAKGSLSSLRRDPGHASWDVAERRSVGDPLAGQIGRRFCGCYPPQNLSQSSEHLAFRSLVPELLMPEAARERVATPPAGTALPLPAPTCLRRRPFGERDWRLM